MVSAVELQAAQTQTDIADTQLKVINAELASIQFSLKSVQNNQIFFENGDASYWQKTIDALKFKVFDSESKSDELQAQLKQFSDQEIVERSRLGTDFVEEHRAPFPSVVNAVYIAKGAHIKSGTVLMQVLDCSNPVVIVPIPEARFSDFTIGKKVTINPIDSEQSLAGTIKYISSGPLISQDKTIALQQELTARGNHAVISFDNKQLKDDLTSTCDTTRRAIVTIKTHSLYDKINEWVSLYLGKAEMKLASLNNT
jgi:multidrug resistance efflux pump